MNRFLLTLFFAGFALACSSPALAGGADGIYKPTELSGYVKLGGKKFNLPLKELRAALLDDGVLVIRNNRIPVDKVNWARLMEKFRFKGLKGRATVKSPNQIVLRERGDDFIGQTSEPLIITQKGKVKFITVKAKMNTRLVTKIEDDLLEMEAPVTISAFGVTARGRIEMKAKRQPLPPIPLRP
jgi:hypothetical protein